MKALREAMAYLAGCIIASAFYVFWFCKFLQLGHGDEALFVVLLFWAVNGPLFTLVALALPWYWGVQVYKRFQKNGASYFPIFGAMAMVVLGTSAIAISPKFGIEPQSFFAALEFAVKQQGICLFIMGGILGITYWILSNRRAKPTP